MAKAKTDFKALIGAARKQDVEPASQEKSEQDLEIPVKSSPTGVDGGPRYLTLAVKTVRLRSDQRESLTLIASRLSRAKRGGERITDDTLIRVAVDALLKVADQLEGHSESELQQRYYELLKF
jgi:hypothetical protein